MTPQELNAVKDLAKALGAHKKALDDHTKALKENTRVRRPVTITSYSETLPPKPDEETPDSGTPAIEEYTNSGAKLPAYLMPGSGETINFDEATSNGHGRFDENGITIHIPSHYYTDLVRAVIAEGEPVAFTVGINHRKPVNV